MDIPAFCQAMRNDPEDDGLRLVFADWLEEHGEGDRAAWVRASVEFQKVSYADPSWGARLKQAADCWERCRPAWWEDLASVNQRNDRGIYRFELGGAKSTRGPTPVQRVGKAAWLGQAFAEGWLLCVDHQGYHDELGPLMAKWTEPVRRIPLWARPLPQVSDAGLRELLALPQLEGLDLLAHPLRNPVARELSNYPAIRYLAVEVRLVDDPTVDAVLRQVAAMPGLRRLRLKGHDRLDYGRRPNDADLKGLVGLTALNRLVLEDCPAVTDAGIEQVRQALPSCVVRRNR